MKTVYLTPDDNLQKTFDNISEPTVIYLKSGIYRQKAELAKDNVTLVGESRETTVISYGDYARKIHADGQEYNTFRTYTLCITGNNVRLKNLTVENSNTDPAALGQCVALSVHGGLFSAENVDLKSTQDTLFLSPFPDDLAVRYIDFLPPRQLYREGHSLHLFENCRIYGTVDFIFGCSEAYFNNCEIISVYDSRNIGFVAAPAHPLAEAHGFNFIDCKFSSSGAAQSTVYLARPWRDFGKAAFINCTLDGHVNPALFDKWNDTARDRTARFSYYGLTGKKINPVSWSEELSALRAENIISAYKKYLTQFKEV